MIRLDGTRLRRSGVLAYALPSLEHRGSGTAQVQKRGEEMETQGPDVFTPTPGPEETSAHA
jgi:hypothetical protein